MKGKSRIAAYMKRKSWISLVAVIVVCALMYVAFILVGPSSSSPWHEARVDKPIPQPTMEERLRLEMESAKQSQSEGIFPAKKGGD